MNFNAAEPPRLPRLRHHSHECEKTRPPNPHEQSANPHVDESIEFRYFFTRKVCLVKYSCAFIVMPGGLGTLDELFEAMTLIQCRKIGPFPVILMGTDFWQGLREWSQHMMKAGVFQRDEVKFGT